MTRVHSNSLDLSKGAFTDIATIVEGEVGSEYLCCVIYISHKSELFCLSYVVLHLKCVL